MPETVAWGRDEQSRACYQFDAELADHLEGENRPGVVAHVKECPFCRPVLADLELIRSVSRLLPLEEPPATVWANVRAALAAEGLFREQTSGWRRSFEHFGMLSNPTPFAALACLVIFATVLVLPPVGLDWRESSRSPARAERVSVVPATGVSMEESKLERAVSEVESSYRARETSMEPAVKATYQKSLESLNASIRECRASIDREPSNTLAREYLLSAYAQKAQVLTTALEYDTR